jgi:hypothetical protein
MNKFKLSNINNNYNKLKKDISQKIKLDKKYDFIFDEDNNKNIVELKLDNKVKLKGEYNIVGLYNSTLSIWYWGWNIAFINKSKLIDKEKIKEFKKLIEDNYFNDINIEELYYLVSNDNFYISEINMNNLIKLILYLIDGVWIFPIKSENNKIINIKYIIITKIYQINL